MNTLTGEILTLPKMSGSVSTPKSLSGNVGAKTINIGGKGDDGATFTPSVSADGIISWTNDKDLPNPEPVNIKGKDGKDGVDGKTPVKNVDYFDGKDGKDGNGIKSAVLNADYTLTITFTDGTTYTTPSIRGATGASGKDGQNGTDGKDGYTPVKGKDYFDGSDGQDGKDGADGKDGQDGSDGITPHIGANGNWFIGNTDTGKPSRGADGQNGKDGKDGAQGEQGIQGVQGEKGDTGAQGAKGDKGDTGANGVSATHSWNGTVLTVTSASGTSSADLKGAKGDKGDTGATGATGQRGTGLLAITTAPSSYTTEVNGITPTYRIALSTVKSQAGVDEVLVGDTLRYSYYHYPIIYVDASYVYCRARVSIRGATGKTAYQYAQDGGYNGTESEFASKLANEYTLNPLYGKKVSFLGDSICAGDSATHLGGYGKIIADRNNMVYENVARAGATVTAETYSRSTGNPKPWICRMVENMSADADYAIIEGGINDGWDETVKGKIGSITKGYNATLDDTTYYGAFESMLKQLVTKYQGKKIGYIAVPKIHNLYDSNQNAPNFYHAALECCAKWGVPVCDLNTITPPVEYLSDLGTTYTADGTHPTYEGYIKYYCDPIEAWMKTLTTGASVSVGVVPSDLDSKYMLKNDVQIKKAQLTLEDGSTVLIDVVVASSGTTIQKYLNRIPTSINADGSIYNGTGYKVNTRLSSSGVEKTTSGGVATGFVAAVGGDDIYLGGGAPWYSEGHNDNYVCAYDSNFNFVGGVYNTVGGFYYTKNIAAAHDIGDTCKITLASGLNIAYIRASWPSGTITNAAPTSLILTVNEEIT